MRKRLEQLVLLAVLQTCLFTGPVMASSDTFSSGVAAFRSGDYQRALIAFEQARRENGESGALLYNLAVTRYRLEDFPQAKKTFLNLLDYPDWRALSLYNLGLVSEKLDQPDQAIDYYQRAVEQSEADGNKKVLGLAHKKLGKQAPLSAYLYAATALGSDSNPAFAPDDLGANATARDRFAELVITGRQPLSQAWAFEGILFGRRYREADRFNDSILEGRLSHHHRADGRHDELGGSLSIFYLDGERFQSRAGLFGQRRQRVAPGHWLVMDLEAERIDAPSRYAYLQGEKIEAGIDWRFAGNGLSSRLGYELQFNDRQDLRRGDDFESFSPIRHRLRARIARSVLSGLQLTAGIKLEQARYRSEHRIDGAETRRRDRQINALVRAALSLSDAWTVFSDVQRDRQSSTLDQYEYRRTVFRLGLEYQR
jgi:tetratricopeptide (TPR) repeat protein